MFILKKGHQPGVYVPLRALFLVRDQNVTVQCGDHNDNEGCGICHYLS